MKELLSLYKHWKGQAPLKVETLPKAGATDNTCAYMQITTKA